MRYAYYMEQVANDDRRRYKRFFDRSFARAEVVLVPCPPLYGEPATGALADLSAGGMSLYLPELLPKNVFLKMTIIFPDASTIDSVVKVRRVAKKGHGSYFLHGFEFLNPSPETIEKINAMAEDCLSCDNRIKKKEAQVCQKSCAFSALCNRSQRTISQEDPTAVLQLEVTAVVPTENSSWSTFKSNFVEKVK